MPAPQSTDAVRVAVGRLAQLQRRDRPTASPKVLDDARNEFVAAKVERAIEDALNPADPDYKPLRKADRKRLAALLRP